ncbi:unnamed protein product [Phyllotreta striolata]|uniref:Uncharacterized protein n=1 Tax=Phyllotreta striolata TaxID=444603 RepID=A0A9N9XLL3_PHYSR|nr:unnamed protein product [Phyllotreta striolata]
MEKTKKLSKILLQFHEIVEEKQSIQENLEQIINQIYSATEYLKENHNKMKPKEITHVHKHCIDVLKQLTDINSNLEELVLENPLEPLHIKEQIFHDKPGVSNTSCVLDIVEKEAPVLVKTECLTNTNVQTHNDIQEAIDYCDENLINSISYPSTSLVYSTADDIQIPEKDVNVTQELPAIEKGLLSEDCAAKQPVIKSTSPLICYSPADTAEDSYYSASPSSSPVHFKPLGNISKSNDPSKCSTLEKLNNYMPSNKDVESCRVENAPDIRLKPKCTIQNDLHDVSKPGKFKDEFTVTYELKPKKTPEVGQECVMSHIESLDEFYIHVVDCETSEIDDLNKRINDFCGNKNWKSNYSNKTEALNNIGRFCVALTDDRWYRAEILNAFNKKQDEVLVRLVDYGTTLTVSYKKLMKLKEWMTYLPMLAVRCHFPLFYPPSSTKNNKLAKWPQESREGLINLCGLGNSEGQLQYFKIEYAQETEQVFRFTYKFSIQQLFFYRNSLAVDLVFSEKDNDGTTVGEILLESNLAVQILDEYDDADLEQFLEDVSDVEIDNVNEAFTGYDAKDEARICKFARNGTCFKGKNCKLEHDMLPRDGFTTDKEAIFKEPLPFVPPAIETTVMILITGYIDTCRFFAQIINTPCKIKEYAMDRDFVNLMNQINSRKNQRFYETFKVLPSIGEIVIVMHWKQWSRGVVRDITIGDDTRHAQAKVFLVDFGELVQCSVSELRKIQAQFLELPFQAVECQIYEYEMSKSCSEDKAKKFFHEHMYFRNFTATVLSCKAPLKLEVKNLNGSIRVGKTLEEKGFAVKYAHDVNVDDNCLLDLS